MAQPDAQADEATQAQAEAQSEAARPEILPEQQKERKAASNVLVAYFSWADNAVLDGDVGRRFLSERHSAGKCDRSWQAGCRKRTGGDLFSIRVTDPYPGDWDECLDRANEERGEDARPAASEKNVENLDSYDTVFLGYPNWWYGVPMALLSLPGRQTICPASRCICV